MMPERKGLNLCCVYESHPNRPSTETKVSIIIKIMNVLFFPQLENILSFNFLHETSTWFKKESH